MTNDDVISFGKIVQDFYKSIFDEGENFLFSLNGNMFDNWVNTAKLNKEELIKKLESLELITIKHEHIKIAVAANLIRIMYECLDEDDSSLAESIENYYGNSDWKEYVDDLWLTTGQRSVHESFLEKKRTLITQLNNHLYDDMPIMKIMRIQMFPLNKGPLRDELIRIWNMFGFSINKTSLTDIIQCLQTDNSWNIGIYENYFHLAKKNLAKIVALELYAYSGCTGFDKEIKKYSNPNNTTNLNTVNHYEFQLVYDLKDKNWLVDIYKNEEYLEEESNDNVKSYGLLSANLGPQIQCFFEKDDENEQYCFYRRKKNSDFEELRNREILLLTEKKSEDLSKCLQTDKFLIKNLYIYKIYIDSDEILNILQNQINDEKKFRKPSLKSKFLGGIKIGDNRWLKDCEPNIPDECSVETKDNKIFRITCENQTETIEYVDPEKDNSEKVEIEKDNIGWQIVDFHRLSGFDAGDFYDKRTEAKVYPFGKNQSFIGTYDGKRITVTKAWLNDVWGFKPIKDCYIFGEDPITSIGKMNLIPNKKIDIGCTITFQIMKKNDTDIALITEVIGKPYRVNPKYPGFLFYKENKSLLVHKNLDIKTPFQSDFSFNQIIENAIKSGAVLYKTSSQLDLNRIKIFIELAKKENQKDYFLVFENCQLSILNENEELKKIIENSNFPRNISIFFIEEKMRQSEQAVVSGLNDANFREKQKKLLLWLKYIGFADWRTVNDACNQLVAGDPAEIQEFYGINPIYKLFYPLVANGDVEICKKEILNNIFGNETKDEKYGFTVIENNIDNVKTPEQNALELLKKFPNLKEYISKNWPEQSVTGSEICYPKDTYGFMRSWYDNREYWRTNLQKYLNDNTVCYFKEKPNTAPYVPDMVALKKDSGLYKYTIPVESNFESSNYAKILWLCRKDFKLFSYDNEKQELECRYYGMLPIIIQRALILFDKEQLKNNEIYKPNRGNIKFTKVPFEAIPELKRIFGENVMEEK